MNEFRIIQTQALTNVLPYEVEECRRVWYWPQPVWRSLQERVLAKGRYRMVPRRFQTPLEAQSFTERLVVLRTQRETEQAQRLEDQRQRQQLPRVVQMLSLPA